MGERHVPAWDPLAITYRPIGAARRELAADRQKTSRNPPNLTRLSTLFHFFLV